MRSISTARWQLERENELKLEKQLRRVRGCEDAAGAAECVFRVRRSAPATLPARAGGSRRRRGATARGRMVSARRAAGAFGMTDNVVPSSSVRVESS